MKRLPLWWWLLPLQLILSMSFALLPMPAQAAARAWLDRDRIELGETATLNVETDQATAQAPDYAALQGAFELSGHSSSRSFSLANGQQQTRVLYAVALKPLREGVLSIPALRVGNASTARLQLSVVPAPVTPARDGAPPFIESEADLQTPYVQQSVGYVLRLYYLPPLVSGTLDQPVPEGASMQRIGSDLQFTREIDGRRYTVVERRYQVVPERSGTLTIPGARFEGRGAGGFFDDIFSDGRRALTANGAPRILQVQAVPDGAPQPWLPLHALDLRYVESPTSARAGSAATIVVEARADGAVGTQVPELQLPQIAGVQVFAEPAQIDESFDHGRPQTRVTRKFSIVPSQPGALRLPGPRIGWWDVRAGAARTASLPAIALDVEAGTGTGSGTAAGDSAPSSLPGGRPAGLPVAGPSSLGLSVWMVAAMVFALLWLLTLWWGLGQRRRAQALPHARSGPGMTAGPAVIAQSARAWQSRAWLALLQTGDAGEIAHFLCVSVSPEAGDLDALLARLQDPAQRQAVRQLQQARWGGGDMAVAREALRVAFQSGIRTAAPASADATALPPLYP